MSAVAGAAIGPLLCVSYFVSAKAGLTFAATHDAVTLVWPPTGIALAALYFSRCRHWAWIAAGALALNVSIGLPPTAAFGIAAGNTLAMVAGAAALRRIGFRPELHRVADVGRLFVVGAIGATAISATIGTTSLLAAKQLSASELASAWWTWWLGDGLGVLFLAPLIFTSGAAVLAGRPNRPRLRLVLPALAILFLFAVLLLAWWQEAGGHYVLLFAPVPLVIWIALRSGQRGVSWVVFALIATGTTLTANGIGPFATQDREMGLLMLLGFVGGTAVIGFLLAASRAEERTAAQRLRRAAAVFNHAGEGIAILDTLGRVVLVNDTFRRLCGLEKGDEREKSIDEFRLGGSEAEDFDALCDALAMGREATGEACYRRGAGGSFPAWESWFAVWSPAGEVDSVIGILSDISRIKDYEKRLAHDARHDPLTGLINRRTFREELDRALIAARRHERPLGLLFVDLDRFKLINDTFGHQAGDELLVQVSSRLRESVRGEDIVARLGGDEFTVLLPEVDGPDGVRLAARQIVEGLRAPLDLVGEQVIVRTSIGAACYPDDGEDADGLLRAADGAMFRAKSMGSGAICMVQGGAPDPQEVPPREIALVESALAAGYIELLYQPVVCGRTGRLEGLEALVRGRVPGLEHELSAGSFVEAAERLGESARLTALVLSRVREDLAAWAAEGLAPAEVAVNLPGRLVLADSGLEELRWLLEELGFGQLPTRLNLEICEGALKAAQHARGQLAELRTGGVGLCLDAFGLGGSSLPELRDTGLDGVKLDRELVAAVPGDEADETLCRCLIQVARSFGLRVVAVGVESEAQRDFLLEQGCELMQGRLFHAPVRADAIADVLRAQPGSAGDQRQA